MNKDHIKGNVKEAKGKIKEVAATDRGSDRS